MGHTSFKAGAGLGAQSGGAAAAAHEILREHGGLEPNPLRGLGDSAALASHHASQCNALAAMADQKIVFAQLEGLSIEQLDRLTAAGRSQAESLRAQVCEPVAVVGVQGLAGFQHHQIGDVHHGVDAALAGSFQTLPQPLGGWPIADPLKCCEGEQQGEITERSCLQLERGL